MSSVFSNAISRSARLKKLFMNLFEGEQQVGYVKTVGDHFIGGGRC